MGIEDSYTAYCFNEACATIMYRIEKGEKPYFPVIEAKSYSRPSELYSQIKQKGGCKM